MCQFMNEGVSVQELELRTNDTLDFFFKPHF